MDSNSKNLEKLSRLLGVMDEDHLSKEDFVKHFEMVLKLVKDLKESNTAEFEAIHKVITNLSNKALNDISVNTRTTRGELLDLVRNEINKISKEHVEKMLAVDAKLATVKDGKDADEDKIFFKVIANMPEPYDPTAVDEELSNAKEAIVELQEEVEELKNRKLGGKGGGTSAIGVQYALGNLIKAETPTGDIDGANKAYTLTAPPHAIISLTINGMVVHPAEYTLAGGTITFGTALDSSLSGTAFTCVYV